jgi:hypothetical protein
LVYRCKNGGKKIMQVFDFVMSDWGILAFIIMSIMLLITGAYFLLLSGDVIGKARPLVSGTTVTSRATIIGGKRFKWPFIMFGIVLVLCSWAGLSFWGQINTGVPYVPSADFNLWFITMVGFVIATLFIMSLVFLKSYATVKTNL